MALDKNWNTKPIAAPLSCERSFRPSVDFGACDMLANLDRNIAAEMLDLYGLVAQFLLGRETTLVYYNPAGLDCSWSVLWQRNLTTHPQIVWQRSYPYPDLYDRFNSGLMVLACLSTDSSAAAQLETLASSLRHLRTVPLLIEVAGSDQESLASQLLSFCLRQSMLYVEMYFRNYNHSLILYTYRTFPKFELVKRGVSGGKGVEIFANKLVNLQGHRLRVMPDLSPPNTFLYRDARGESQVAGYLWDFMATFASRINAGLAVVRPNWRAGGASESSYMLQYSGRGLIDVGLTTTLITKRNLWAIHQYTSHTSFSPRSPGDQGPDGSSIDHCHSHSYFHGHFHSWPSCI